MSTYMSLLKIKDTIKAQKWLSERYKIHQQLYRAFPKGIMDNYNGKSNLLYFVNKAQSQVIVQSPVEPNWGNCFQDFDVVDEIQVKQFNPKLENNQKLRMFAEINPTRNIYDGKVKKRIGVWRFDDVEKWLELIAKKSGFTVNCLSINNNGKIYGKNQEARHQSVNIDAVITIIDTKLFKQKMQTGLGRGKFLGFGLMLLRKV